MVDFAEWADKWNEDVVKGQPGIRRKSAEQLHTWYEK
jgi:hypothetical protein